MSTTAPSGQYGRIVTTQHALDRYEERFDADVPLTTAWERGVEVELPDKHYDEARFYPPADAAMTTKDDAITTAMHSEDLRIEAPGKMRCGGCDAPHEPLGTDEVCPYCGATVAERRSTGAITIVDRRGGN